MLIAMREPRCTIADAVVQDIPLAIFPDCAAFALAVGQVIIYYWHSPIALVLGYHPHP